MKRGTVVVGAPSYSGEGKPPLFGFRGDAFARAAGFRDRADLAEAFDVVFLLDYWPGMGCCGKESHFPVAEARPKALELITIAKSPIVVLGRIVAKAFSIESPENFVWYTLGGVLTGVVPYPSRLDAFWDNAQMVGRITDFFDSGFPEIGESGR